MDRRTKSAAGSMSLSRSMRRRNTASPPDMRGLAGSLVCAALACAIASVADIQNGNYLPGLLGWLLVARLLQRTLHVLAHPHRPAPDDWATPVLGTAWVFVFILANQAEGFYWCIPGLLAIAMSAPLPVVGPVAGALAALTALATYPASGMELAGTAGLLLACTGAIGSFAAGRAAQQVPAEVPESSTRWGSAATLYWEAEGNAILYSASFKTMLGYSADKDQTPFNFFDLVHPDDRAGLERIFRAELRGARTGRQLKRKAAQIRLLARDGTWRWVLADIVALFVTGPAVRQCICSFVDITSHVVAQDALAASRRTLQAQSVELLEARERLRNSELARHDLQKLVPLAWEAPAKDADSVLALLQGQPGMNDGTIEAIAKARSHLEDALRRTQWVIQLALMEQDKWHPLRAPFDVLAMASEVVSGAGPLATSRGVVIEQVAHAGGVFALGHEGHCRIALEAIVRDAIMTSEPGSLVTLSGAVRSGRVGVELRQTTAMSATRQATYFDRPLPSGGIPPVSPYAARMIVRAQGGDVVIGASSRRGTSLIFMLEPATDNAAQSRYDSGLDILVTGGSACRQSVIAACAGMKAEVRYALDGAAAIDAVIRRRPDVIAVDVSAGLDGFRDGFSAIRSMQRDAAEPASLWIALGTVEAADTAHFSHCFAGPASSPGLAGLLRAVLADKHSSAAKVVVDNALLQSVPDYVGSRKRMAAELREALLAGRRVEAARIAHLLGGSPGIQGFEAAVLACRAIGDLDSNESQQRLLSRMDEVDSVLSRLEA